MSAEFTILKDLNEQIEKLTRDDIFQCETGWDDTKYVIQEKQTEMEDCLNELKERFDKLERIFTDFDTSNDMEQQIERMWPLVEALRGFLRWSK